jgi:Skp family chaperone for outer membrane proteins
MNRLIALWAVSGLLFLPGKIAAQNTERTQVGVVNVLRAIVETQEGKAANQDFQKKYEARRDELLKKQKELEDLQQQLKSQSNTLNDQARSALARNIDTKTTELQRAQEDAEKEFNQLRNDIFNRIGSKLAPLIQEYAKEHKFTLVLDSSNENSQLSYIDPVIDITDDVIKRYDAAQVSSSVLPAATQSSPSAPANAAPAAAKPPIAPPKKN